MICLLYSDWLYLATASKLDQIYKVHTCLALDRINVEEVDNGRGTGLAHSYAPCLRVERWSAGTRRQWPQKLTEMAGLQCHTAPFSWKLVFQVDCELYEIIMTACTPKEEVEWRCRLTTLPASQLQQQSDPHCFSCTTLNIKSLGTVYGRSGRFHSKYSYRTDWMTYLLITCIETLARKISIHRATTVGPRFPLCQVILKNTSIEKEVSFSNDRSSVNRSKSLLTTNSRIPILAPSRGERARLEALLSDVWSREILPFPGMTVRARSEHLVRSSASTVMRKLSVVNLANTFTRRSSSFNSNQKVGSGEETAVTAVGNDLVPRQEEIHDTAGDVIETFETAAARYPTIKDEIDSLAMLDPRSPMPTGKSHTEIGGTVGRLGAFELENDWEASNLDGCLSIPRTPSKMITRRVGRVNSKASKEPGHVDTEDGFFQKTYRAASVKSVSRWTRASGTLQRGVLLQSIRSFFAA